MSSLVAIHAGLGALALSVALAAGLARADAEAPRAYRWRLAATEDGCRTWVSDVAGKPYVAARAECVIEAGRARIGAVLQDIDRFPAWVQGCTEAKVLRVVDRARDAYVLWLRQHIPLLKDRDVVLRSEARLAGDRAVIVASATRELDHDAGKGYVRMPSFSSEWVIEPIDAEHARVSFMIDPDLGDGLPTGTANARIRDTPLATIKGLARLLRSSR